MGVALRNETAHDIKISHYTLLPLHPPLLNLNISAAHRLFRRAARARTQRQRCHAMPSSCFGVARKSPRVLQLATGRSRERVLIDKASSCQLADTDPPVFVVPIGGALADAPSFRIAVQVGASAYQDTGASQTPGGSCDAQSGGIERGGTSKLAPAPDEFCRRCEAAPIMFRGPQLSEIVSMAPKEKAPCYHGTLHGYSRMSRMGLKHSIRTCVTPLT